MSVQTPPEEGIMALLKRNIYSCLLCAASAKAAAIQVSRKFSELSCRIEVVSKVAKDGLPV